jgi:hypothetical protein
VVRARLSHGRGSGSIPDLPTKKLWYHSSMKDTTGIGSVTEAMVLAALIRQGKQVYIPFSGDSRSDLIVDGESGLIRIQCKTGRLRNGCVEFRNYSQTSAGLRPYQKKDVDVFGVYCPANGKVYVVPIEECGGQLTLLRIEPTKNNYKKGVRFAVKYEV